MSYWTFSDVFEEGGPAREPFYGGFGLIAPGGIKKPSYYAFSLFHKLGKTRLVAAAENVLVTKREDGSLVVAIWNLWPPNQSGAVRNFDLEFRGVKGAKKVRISRIDAQHSNTMAVYKSMGSPRYPTEKQVEEMNRQTALRPPEETEMRDGHLKLRLPVNGFALLEVAP